VECFHHVSSLGYPGYSIGCSTARLGEQYTDAVFNGVCRIQKWCPAQRTSGSARNAKDVFDASPRHREQNGVPSTHHIGNRDRARWTAQLLCQRLRLR
jgi:hypothetical protein